MRSDARFLLLRERLLQAGVAPKRVRRYLAELSDHLDDLIRQQHAAGYSGEDGQSRARALLGSDEELAQGWLTDPRLKSFTARAPWAVIPGALLVFLALGFLLWFGAWFGIGTFAHGPMHGKATADWFLRLTGLLSPVGNFIVLPLAALLLALVVRRQRLNPLWAILPALPLLILRPGLVLGAEPHTYTAGAALFTLAQYPLPQPAIAIQTILILAPGLLLALDRYRRRKQMGPHAL